jgi:hypothetical protein
MEAALKRLSIVGFGVLLILFTCASLYSQDSSPTERFVF